MELKYINCLKICFGLFIGSTIAWFCIPFIDLDTAFFLLGSICSWTGFIITLNIILQLRKASLTYDKILLLWGFFSISLGAWLLTLGISPDNLPFLIGSISSGFGVITVGYFLYNLKAIPKNTGLESSEKE